MLRKMSPGVCPPGRGEDFIFCRIMIEKCIVEFGFMSAFVVCLLCVAVLVLTSTYVLSCVCL